MVLDSDSEPDLGFGEGSPFAAHLDRGWSLLERGDVKGARQSGLKAKESLPDEPDAYMLLAAAAHLDGQYDEAFDWYDDAIDRDPEYPEPYLSAAQMLIYEQGCFSRALVLLDQVSHLEGLLPVEHAEIRLLRAEAMLEDPLNEGSIEPFTTGEGVDDLRAMFDLGALHPDQARPELEQRINEFNGQDSEQGTDLDEEEFQGLLARMAAHCFRLARLDCEIDQDARAALLLKQVLHTLPSHAECWHLLSECEYRQGHVRDAMDAAFRVYALDGEQTQDIPELDDQALHAQVSALYATVVRNEPFSAIEQALSLDITFLDRPAVELLYEGLDPRAPFVILRPSIEQGQAPHPGTLVVYRQNLLRMIEPGPDPQLGPEVREQLEDIIEAQHLEPPNLNDKAQPRSPTPDKETQPPLALERSEGPARSRNTKRHH